MGMDGWCRYGCVVVGVWLPVVGVMCLIAKMFMNHFCSVTFYVLAGWQVEDKWSGGNEDVFLES